MDTDERTGHSCQAAIEMEANGILLYPETENGVTTWWLTDLNVDNNEGRICAVDYCPWCGQKLEE